MHPSFRNSTGERVYHLLSSVKTRLWTAFVAGQFARCGTGVRITPPFRYSNLQHIALEDDVTIHRDCWIATLNSEEEMATPKLIIKSHANIGMGATISAVKRVVLEEHVLLARNVYISDHGHAFENVNLPIVAQGIRNVADVVIGAHTWLGQNVCVLPGVTIGRHCVVGSNSVVTKSLPDYCVAVGTPARVLKRYDPETKRWENAAYEPA